MICGQVADIELLTLPLWAGAHHGQWWCILILDREALGVACKALRCRFVKRAGPQPADVCLVLDQHKIVSDLRFTSLCVEHTKAAHAKSRQRSATAAPA